jgi:arsenite methyltransferase
MVAVTSLKREVILDAVETMYTWVARDPRQSFHFPVGREACRQVGYPDVVLDHVPEPVLESFAGVGYPFAADVIRPGDTVLDLGSGSGTDAFIAARLAGPAGKVYALDMTAAMREKLAANIEQAGVTNIEILAGNLEDIPLEDRSVDVVTSNGVLNLVPDKKRAIGEIARVLKPGGRVQISDIALTKRVSGKARRDPKAWAECIVGALEEARYFSMFRDAGLAVPEHLGELDYFAGSSSEDTRLMASYFGARSVTFRAHKPAEAVRAPKGSPLRRLVANGVGMFGSIAGASAAGAACFGAPALISLFSAMGATALTDHATLYPIFVAFVALSTWQLYRSVRRREAWGPFLLGAAGALAAAVVLWLMVTGIYPLPAAALYGAIGVLVAGTVWEIWARYHEDCIVKVRRELRRPEPHGSSLAVGVNGAVLSVAAAAAFYGMHKSVDTLRPAAAEAEIACYGINACKGQAACQTAFNACPGMNACKGKGFVYTTATDCAKEGGVPLEDSPAAPNA